MQSPVNSTKSLTSSKPPNVSSIPAEEGGRRDSRVPGGTLVPPRNTPFSSLQLLRQQNNAGREMKSTKNSEAYRIMAEILESTLTVQNNVAIWVYGLRVMALTLCRF